MSEEMWINHFTKMAEGKVPLTKDFCIVDEGYKRPQKHHPKVQVVTPTEQSVQRAKESKKRKIKDQLA